MEQKLNKHEGKALKQKLQDENILIYDFAGKIRKPIVYVNTLFDKELLSMDDKALVSYYFQKPFSEAIK